MLEKLIESGYTTIEDNVNTMTIHGHDTNEEIDMPNMTMPRMYLE